MSISTSKCELLLPYIRHLHLSDGAGLDGEGLQIGEGAIDWVHFFRVLGDYHGTMIPEIWRGHQRQGEGFSDRHPAPIGSLFQPARIARKRITSELQ